MSTRRKRLPLRERVAARKAGRSEYVDGGRTEEGSAWRHWLGLTAVAFQIVALVLTIWEVWTLSGSGFVGVDYTRITVYVVVFFLGRAIQILLKIRKP